MESELDHTGKHPSITNHILESLFFSMSVYEPTVDALLKDLHPKFGRVQPLMSYGFDGKGQQAIFVARSHSGRVIVACRGTSGFRDLVQDLKYMKSRLSFAKGAAAHWGFAERAESVPIDFLCNLLDAGEEIIFTGHSLGGAVASLLTLRVLESTKGMFDEQVRCITFGSPLFASCRLAEIINEKYKDIFIHIVSKRDCVPKILPFVSTLQKLVYADEDHLEGLVVLKTVLEFLPWLPIAPLLTGLERKIPALCKFLLRCVMKLALPSGLTGSYAFAGHIVMLDTVTAVNVDNSLILTSAEDLNAWHSQLNFAFGSGFDIKMIAEHMLDCYHDGIVRAFSQVRVTRELAKSGAAVGPITEGRGEEKSKQFCESSDCDAGSGTTVVARLFPQLGGAPESCEVRVGSMLLGHETHGGEQRRGGMDNWVVRSEDSTCWKSAAAKPILTRAKSQATLTRTISAGEESLVRVRPLYPKLERSVTMTKSVSRSPTLWTIKPERRQQGVATRKEVSSTRRCRACSCLHMYMNIKGSCRQVTKSFLDFGWILGTIGRVARHLKILDNLCALTFIRLIVGNIIG